MRLFILVIALPACGLLLSGCLSAPRDFASPSCKIKFVDEHGEGFKGIRVERHWEDREKNCSGQDFVLSDDTGSAEFAKVPAHVGLFTGVAEKTLGSLGPCAWGSGTSTSIVAHYPGRHIFAPEEKRYRQTAPNVFVDGAGLAVWVSTDRGSNTFITIYFPQSRKSIDYTLVTRRQNE